MTRAYITLADPGGAAAVLAQADDILRQRPDLGVLPSWLASCKPVSPPAPAPHRRLVAHGRRAATSAVVVHALSYAEIGERLYVSKNTVKTQAYSAYRKLGVSSRSEAVVRTRELGLDAL
jgi:Response regulator containing a CheY-like receiver domain and an HTH DNA-binding domain